ncbi:hypothetical protein F53441_8635 [Fusarium austroafricanum]|uniref:Uncharacterized protein n=1 Tax=Fusarium austroafricanum TaxID=2364996 RepID=A0A8H4NU88_9HYPO|nr:hypothetical protein F53441_8635 [Fusarium austroafricanum]
MDHSIPLFDQLQDFMRDNYFDWPHEDMSDGFDAPVVNPRCGLCQFEFQIGETIYVFINRLPLEVCEKVASYCLREHATKLFRDVWLQRDRSSSKEINLRLSSQARVWAQHVEIEGRQYVKSITTRRQTKDDTRLVKCNTGDHLNIYFAEDSLGIREVIITHNDELPPIDPDAGLRWVVNRHRDVPFSINMKSDIVLDRNVIRDIIPNKPEGLSSSLIDAYSRSDDTWLYIPVDPDERVSELWLRKYKSPAVPNETIQSLVILTNKGRSFALGPHIESLISREDCEFSYEALSELPATAPSKMFYYKSDCIAEYLGFEQVMTWDKRQIEISCGKSSKPSPYKGKTFLSTYASLGDVRTITPCRSRAAFDLKAIVGLLFTYTDGRQRCIGQVRLDWLEDPLVVTSEKIWLGCAVEEVKPLGEGFWPPTNRIKWVSVSKPLADGKRQYLEIPLSGRLEWQKIGISNSVCHHEARELPDEMDAVLAHEAASGKPAPKVVRTFSV